MMARAQGDGIFHGLRIDIGRSGINAHKDGLGAGVGASLSGGDERV